MSMNIFCNYCQDVIVNKLWYYGNFYGDHIFVLHNSHALSWLFHGHSLTMSLLNHPSALRKACPRSAEGSQKAMSNPAHRIPFICIHRVVGSQLAQVPPHLEKAMFSQLQWFFNRALPSPWHYTCLIPVSRPKKNSKLKCEYRTTRIYPYLHFVTIVEWTLRQLRITKTFRSCRPAWMEMDRKICPTATTSLNLCSSDQFILIYHTYNTVSIRAYCRQVSNVTLVLLFSDLCSNRKATRASSTACTAAIDVSKQSKIWLSW